MNRSFAMTALMALLAGCATSGHDVPDSLALSPSFKEARPDKKPALEPQTAWWASFRDVQLNALVANGLVQNLTVAQARERINAALATERVNGSAYSPSINGSAGATRSGTDNGVVTTNTDTASAGVSSNWKLDLFGGGRKTAEEFAAKTLAAREALNGARLDLIANVANRYFEIRLYEQRLGIASRSLANQRQIVDITHAQLAAGSISELDAAKADASFYTTSADIPTLTASKAKAEHQLAILLGLEPVALGSALAKPKTALLPNVAFSTGIPVDLLRSRPDIRTAEANLVAAAADIGVKEADLYPSLTLSGSLSISASATTIKSWSLGPTLTLPIFDRDRLVANVDLSTSSAKTAYLAYRDTVLKAVGEVEDALVSLKQERIRKGLLTQSVSFSKKAADLSRTQYEAGTASFTDMLNAQTTLYTAENALAQSRYNEIVYYIALCKALGGGWAAGDAEAMTLAAQ